MNIFITSKCPVRCAEYLDDKRVVKMCLETAQLLCSVIPDHDLYRPTHMQHPCTQWAAKSLGNWLWLYNHGLALCDEYESRYGKEHKCKQVMQLIFEHRHKHPVLSYSMSPFPNCTRNKELGIDYRSNPNVFLAYQMYLNDRWDNDKRKPTWYGETA